MPDDRVTVTMLLKDLFSKPMTKVVEAATDLKVELTLTSDELQEYDKAQEKARKEAEKTEKELKKLTSGARALVVGLNSAKLVLKTVGTAFKTMRTAASGALHAVVSLKTALAGLVIGLGVRQIYRTIAGTAEEIDKLAKTSQRLGLTTKELAQLSFAADRAGISFDELRIAVQQSLRRFGDLSRGQGEFKRVEASLKELGLTADQFDLKLHKFPEVLAAVADALQRIHDPAQRVSLVSAIFGEDSGPRIITLLRNGGDAVRGLFEESERLIHINDEQAAVSERLVDSLTNLKFAWLSLRNALVVEVGPAITDVINRLAFFVADAPDRIKGISRAISDAFSSDVDAKRSARALFTALREQVTEFIVTLAVESGKVIGTAFIEAITVGLTALTPVLEDLFRDSLGPLLNKIPGVEIEKSLRGQVKEADALRKQYVALVYQAGILQSLIDSSEVEGARRKWYRQLKDITDQIQDVKEQIDGYSSVEEDFAKQQQERLDLFWTSLRNGFASTSKAADEATGKISAAGSSVEDVLNRFQELGRQGPEQLKKFDVPLADMREAFETAGDSIGRSLANVLKLADRLPAALEKVRVALSELRVRELSAVGRGDEASRLQLLNRFAAERAELEAQFGKAAKQLLPELERVQRLELERFDVEAKIRSVVKEVTDAEDAYKTALQRRNDEAEAGRQITEEQQAELQVLREKLEAAVTTARDALNSIGSDPRFADVVVEGLRRVEQAAAGLAKTGEETKRTFGQGLRQGLKDFAEQARFSFETARRFAQNLLGAIGDGIVGALRSAIEGASSLKEAFVGALRSILADVASLIARLLVMKAIASAFGGPLGALFAQTGGIVGPGGRHMQRFSTGGFVGSGIVPGPPSPRDITPVLAMPGEGFIRKGAVQYYGRGLIAALNNKLVPRELLGGLNRLSTVTGSGAFADGGIVAAGAGARGVSSSVVQPAIVADQLTMDRLLSGGGATLLRFLRDNRGRF